MSSLRGQIDDSIIKVRIIYQIIYYQIIKSLNKLGTRIKLFLLKKQINFYRDLILDTNTNIFIFYNSFLKKLKG